jgi:hypothetical protein
VSPSEKERFLSLVWMQEATFHAGVLEFYTNIPHLFHVLVSDWLRSHVFTDKARHRDTHKLRSHQIAVRVEGWKCVGPVSIDKVGVYFRQALPELYRAVSTSVCSLTSALQHASVVSYC